MLRRKKHLSKRHKKLIEEAVKGHRFPKLDKDDQITQRSFGKVKTVVGMDPGSSKSAPYISIDNLNPKYINELLTWLDAIKKYERDKRAKERSS